MTYIINGFKIETVERESCYRLEQYGRGQTITCKCSICIGSTHAEMKLRLDKIYSKNN